MDNNKFWLKIIGLLDKVRSKREIKKNLKELGDFHVSVIPKIGKTKAKAQIKKDLAGVTATVNADIKVDGKKIQVATKKATKQAQDVANKNAIQVSANVDLKKSKLINDIKVFGKENSKMLNDMQMSSKYSTLLNNAKLATSNKEIKNLRLQLSALKSELKATGMSGLSFGDSLKKTFKRVGEYFISTGGMFLLAQQTKQAWQEALELDEAYTDLIKVQDELTRGDYPEYLERCNEKAQELATTQKAIIEGVTEFSRSGYNLTESNQLAEQANILANVGDMTASDSSKAIISGVQAYEEVHGYTDTIDKAIALIDSYNAIGNTASITSAELAEGVQAVGAVFADSNTSVDEFIALLAAGNRQFQNADTLALGLRTAALRLRSCTTELALLGEETEGVYESTSKLQEKIEGLTNINGIGGVKILEDDGETFRSIYDIFLDISKVYKDMSDTDQSALLSLIAGTHRASAISATLNNMSEAQEIYERSLESAGSAQEEYNKYLESSEASLNRFKASMTETYQSVISGETVTGILNCANATLQFVNGLGLVESSLKGIIAIKIVKAVTMMSASLKASAIQASKFGTALKTVNNMSNMTKGTKEYADALQNLKTSCTGLTEKQLKQVLSNKSLDNSTRIAILRTNGLSKAQAQARLSQMNLTKSTKAQTLAQNTAMASTFSLSAAVKGFAASTKAAFMSNPIGIGIMAISTVIGAVSSKMSEYNEKLRETRQAQMDAADTAKEKADSLKEIYIQYEKLSNIADKTVTEEEDYKQVILEITKALGGRADALEGLKVGTDEYTKALREATKAELENQYATAKVGAKAAEDALKDVTYDAWTGSQITVPLNINMTGIKEHVAALSVVRDILAEFEDESGQISPEGTYDLEWEPVNWDADRSDMNAVVEYYNALVEARTRLVTSDDADFLMESDIYKNISSVIELLSEGVEKYTEQQYNALRLNYEWQNGIPRTEEEFRKMEQSILDASGAGETFKDTLKDYLTQDYGELLTENIDVSGAIENNEKAITVLAETQIEKINEYQERLSVLYEALNMIRSGTATSKDIDALIDKFPELSDDTGDLEGAINSLINNALVAMSDIYGDAIDNVAEFATRQEALTHFVSTTASAIDKITSSYESLNNAIKEYNENGYVSLDTLEQIMKLEPKYLSALMDEEGNIVSNTYAYRDLILMKLRDYELEALKEANLTNDQLKMDYENGSISKVEYDAGLKASDSDLMTKLRFVDSARNNIDKLMDELMSGEKTKDATSSFEQQIDWAANSVSNLEHEVSKLETTLDNTDSYKEQLKAIQDVIDAQNRLKEGYVKSAEVYSSHYEKTLSTGILVDQGLSEDVRKKIESDGLFDIEEFIAENVMSGTESTKQQIYDAIKEAIDWYNKSADASDNAIKVGFEIDEKSKEKVKINRDWYESQVKSLRYGQDTIRNEIDLNGGRGTTEQYNKLIDYEKAIAKKVKERYEKELSLLGEMEEGTAEYTKQESIVADIADEFAECKNNIKDFELEKVNLVLDSIQDNIDDINEKIENQDRFISGAIGILNQEIEVQEGLRDIIQDQIDALQEENDEHERALALEKAKYELQRAQSQRTVKLYSGEDRGFIYTQDREAVRDAQENLDQLEFEATIHALEKQKEYYEDIINNLSEIQEKWNNIASKAQELIDIQYTLSIGGQGIRDSILGDSYDLEGLSNSYQGLLNEQSGLEDLEKSVSDIIAEFEDGTISVEECINQITTVAPQYANLLGTVVNTVLADIEALKGESSKAIDSAEKDATDATNDVTKATENETETQTTLLSEFADTVKKTYSEVVSDIIKDMDEQFQGFTERLTLQASELKDTISGMLADIQKDMGGMEGIGATLQSSSTSSGKFTVESMANGGMITGKDKKLDKLARSLGEDHITMLAYKEGERVLTPVQNEIWEKFQANASNLVMTPPSYDMFAPKYQNVPVSRVANSNQVTIGDIHLHEVQNVPDFAKALQKHLPGISVQYNGKH